MEIHERLKKARERRFKTASEAARALSGGSDKGTSTYLAHENGTTPPPRDAIARYARFFRVSPGWLLAEHGSMDGGIPQVPIVAYVGAGAEVFSENPYPDGRGAEMVDAPTEADGDCVALIVKGDSMHPFRDGWLIFYRRTQEGIADECINQLCVVQVSNGPTLLKELRRGATKRLWTLHSWNAPAREDVRLDWAAKVLAIRPR